MNFTVYSIGRLSLWDSTDQSKFHCQWENKRPPAWECPRVSLPLQASPTSSTASFQASSTWPQYTDEQDVNKNYQCDQFVWCETKLEKGSLSYCEFMKLTFWSSRPNQTSCLTPPILMTIFGNWRLCREMAAGSGGSNVSSCWKRPKFIKYCSRTFFPGQSIFYHFKLKPNI